MYSNNIRKYLIIALVLAWGITLAYLALRTKTSNHPPRIIHGKKNTEISNKEKPLQPIDEALDLLRIRRNKDALVILDKILLNDPKNPEAIWGKAEVFKRARQYKLAELTSGIKTEI